MRRRRHLLCFYALFLLELEFAFSLSLSLSLSLFLSWVVLLLTLSGSFPAREKDLASFFPLLAMFLPIGFHRNSLDFTADLQNTSFFP